MPTAPAYRDAYNTCVKIITDAEKKMETKAMKEANRKARENADILIENEKRQKEVKDKKQILKPMRHDTERWVLAPHVYASTKIEGFSVTLLGL